MEKQAYQIYDKNHNNIYVGYVIAYNENKAIKLVSQKHPHFSDDELEIVWKGTQGTWKAKSFGLKKVTEDVEKVRTYSNVIE